jgi:hypothetical protein
MQGGGGGGDSRKLETELLKSDVKYLDIQEFFQGYSNTPCSTIQELRGSLIKLEIY